MEQYPDFVESTGYGNPLGYGGYNCRHSIRPHLPGISKNPYEDNPVDSEENKKAWQISQRQRAAERKIRATKTELLGYREALSYAKDNELRAALQEDYKRVSAKLIGNNDAYAKFCEKHNLKRYDDRLRVTGWNRSEAAKASAAGRKLKA